MESMELIYYVRQPCVKIDVLDIVVHFNNVLILAFIDEVNQWLLPCVGSPFYYFIHCLIVVLFNTRFAFPNYSSIPCMVLFCGMQQM